MTPNHTLPNVKMPNQYDNKTITTLNLKITKLIPKEDLILIKNNVPGNKDTIVIVHNSIKKKNQNKPIPNTETPNTKKKK